MRVLLDENLPHDLIAELIGHDAVTVQGLGWSGVQNGDLLHRAAGQIDAFVTMDRKLEREHDLTVLQCGVIMLLARSNRVQWTQPSGRSRGRIAISGKALITTLSNVSSGQAVRAASSTKSVS